MHEAILTELLRTRNEGGFPGGGFRGGGFRGVLWTFGIDPEQGKGESARCEEDELPHRCILHSMFI